MMTYAANDYTKGINNLKTIFVTVIGAAGVVVLGYGGLKFAESFQNLIKMVSLLVVFQKYM